MQFLLLLLFLSCLHAEAYGLKNFSFLGEVRLGAIESKDEEATKATSLALGASLGLKTKAFYGVSFTSRLYTTQSLFGKYEEQSFYDSNFEGYTLLGEAFLSAKISNTNIAIGRQLFESPFLASDDSGMIPLLFEGYSLLNNDLEDSFITLASFSKWAGYESPNAESFHAVQSSTNPIFLAGIHNESLENIELQAWHYKLDEANFNYVEVGYENDIFNLGLQYTHQEHQNEAFGVEGEISFKNISFLMAYNKAKGLVSDGFAGDTFFTTVEKKGIAKTGNKEALKFELVYDISDFNLALTHVVFSQNDNETDYHITYAYDEKYAFDLIYANLYKDGNFLRFVGTLNF